MTSASDRENTEKAIEAGEPCPVCQLTPSFTPLRPREMMMGTRETFDYRLCGECGSISINSASDAVDVSKYYDANYYSFQQSKANWLMEAMRRKRDASYFSPFAPIGTVLRRFRHDELFSELARVGLKREHRVLDVGCGAGHLVDRLAAIGFQSVSAIDPFLDATSTTPNGVRLERGDLSEVTGMFDVIMFHHSLEHVPDPAKALSETSKILSPNGLCLVRLPTPSSEAFRTYGDDWVQIDAPRHVALPSRRGMQILAQTAGFRIHETVDDSVGFGFFGSEMVQRNIPFGVGAGDYRDPTTLFSPTEMTAFNERADACNRSGTGDQFLAVLRHAT